MRLDIIGATQRACVRLFDYCHSQLPLSDALRLLLPELGVLLFLLLVRFELQFDICVKYIVTDVWMLKFIYIYIYVYPARTSISSKQC